jgi:hypothetical protein
MPANKKPRKPYRPYRRAEPVFHSLRHAQAVFNPIYRVFDAMAEGWLPDAAGSPVMLDWSGEWVEIAPALTGWADCWDRVSNETGSIINTPALRKIAKKLHAVTPLTEQEVAAGRSAINECFSAFQTVPKAVITRCAETEEIAIKLSEVLA